MATTGDRRVTESGIEVKPVYRPDDASGPAEPPGVPLHARAPIPTCTAAGPGRCASTPASARQRERTRGCALLGRGQTGLSVAFDLPTQLGYDSDDRSRRRGRPHRRRDRLGRRHGPAPGRHPARGGLHLDDDQRAGGAPPPLLRARRGRAGRPGGAPRNGAERRPQGVRRARELHLPAAPVDAAHDRPVRVLRRAHPALEHDLDLRLPHSRGGLDGGPGAGVHPRERHCVLRGCGRGGLSPDSFGERLSFFFNGARGDVQVAKFRAARRMWARIMGEPSLRPVRRRRRSASTPRPAARRSRPSSPRTTSCASPCRRCRRSTAAPSRSTRTASTRRWRCPPSGRRRWRCARSRSSCTRPARRTPPTRSAAPGTWSLTDELEVRAGELIGRIDELGGAVAAIEAGWVQQQIEESAFRWQREVETGERVIVGVNRFTADEPDAVEAPSPRPCDQRRAQRTRTRRCAPPRCRGGRERWPRCGEWRTPARTSFPCLRRPSPRAPRSVSSAARSGPLGSAARSNACGDSPQPLGAYPCRMSSPARARLAVAAAARSPPRASPRASAQAPRPPRRPRHRASRGTSPRSSAKRASPATGTVASPRSRSAPSVTSRAGRP